MSLFHIIFVTRKKRTSRKLFFTYANVATFLGIVFTFVYAAMYFTNTLPLLIPLAVLMVGLSDLLDGHLARKFDQHSFIGKEIDVLRDRLFLAAVLGNIAFLYPGFAVFALAVMLVALEGGIEYIERKSHDRHEKVFVPGSVGWGSIRWFVHLVCSSVFIVQTYWNGLWSVFTPAWIDVGATPQNLLIAMTFFSSLAFFIYFYRYFRYATS